MVQCWRCRHFFRPRLLVERPLVQLRGGGFGRNYSDSSRQITDIPNILSKPSWSVRSLLPSPSDVAGGTRVTSKQLQRLLRLSALPPPRSQEEEAQMLETLESQLHFVREIQKLEPNSVDPLESIRDESAEADSECEIGYEELKEALESEDTSWGCSGAGRRGTGALEVLKEAEDWDVLKQAERKVGRYFTVER
ncbi:MAG: hypothetical protein M1839_001887 [Geoglossum umbratile]|nr:MAG: hypothetical protein M1839_001887 [Geoglossum umbratile]